MKFVVTFALRSELDPWLRRRVFRRTTLNGFPFYDMTERGVTVRAVLTGMGPGPAQEAIRTALACRPDAVLACGLAGALKPCFRVGEVLAPHALRNDCADQQIPCNEKLRRLAIDCGATPVDCLLSKSSIVRTSQEKQLLGAVADAVDMESFAIVKEARLAGVPALALRSVSDGSDCDLPCDFSRMVDGRGRMRLWRMALEPLRAPQTLPELIRFGMASRRAASRLAEFLNRYFQALLIEHSMHDV